MGTLGGAAIAAVCAGGIAPVCAGGVELWRKTSTRMPLGPNSSYE